jgi:superfamily II DNA/RNA helicase
MTYIHRIGRTARAGAAGTAITLIDWDDVPRWKLICDKLDLPFHEPVETYSTSPHLYIDLDIPEDAKSVLPRADRTRAGLDAEQIEDLGGRPPRSSGHSRTRTSPRTDKPRTERTRSERTRTRTRGGKPVDGAGETGGAPGGAAAAAESAKPPRRRRRRRHTSTGGSEGPASD